jgi:hypothetical protein
MGNLGRINEIVRRASLRGPIQSTKLYKRDFIAKSSPGGTGVTKGRGARNPEDSVFDYIEFRIRVEKIITIVLVVSSAPVLPKIPNALSILATIERGGGVLCATPI